MAIIFLHFPLRPPKFGGGAERQIAAIADEYKKTAHNAVCLFSSNKFLISEFGRRNIKAKYIWIGWEPTSILSISLFPLTSLLSFLVFTYLLTKFPRKGAVFCCSLTDKLVFTPLAVLWSYKIFWFEPTRIGRWLFSNPLRPFYRLLSHFVTIIAPSYFSRNQILNLGVNIKNIKVIYPGIKIINSQPRDRMVGLFRLGFLGRLAKEKGVHILLDALKKLPGDFSLIIAGDGSEETNLKNISRRLGLSDRVFFYGYISNLQEFFSKIDLLIVPSILPESFGLVAAEAMSFGIPVAASRIGAISEIIEDNKTGFLFKPGDAGSLCKIITRIKNNYECAGRAVADAKKTVANRFDQERMFKEFLSLVKT